MTVKHYILFSSILTVALVVIADPIASGRSKQNVPDRKLRAKRQTSGDDGEYRNCAVSPTYLPPTTIKTGDRLKALREEMSDNNLKAYIVPSEDAHQSEYIADRDKRRQYISGFSGSSGLAIVTLSEAALWTDGRYFLQAPMELDCNWILQKKDEPGIPDPEDWLVDVLNNGDLVGFDPTIMSISGYNSYFSKFEAVENGGPVLKSLTNNLVDVIWEADTEYPRPAYPDEQVFILDWKKYTGETWQQKIWEFDGQDGLDSVRSKLKDAGAEALVVSKLDEIAWLFNLRGNDVPYNPVFISYLIITLNSIQLYMYDMEGRLSAEVKNHLGIGKAPCTDEDAVGEMCVTVKPYEYFLKDLDNLSENRIWISDQMSYAIYERVQEAKRVLKASPVLLMKAVKSPTEIDGMNNAQLKDSIALCRLGAWMQDTIDNLDDPTVGDINVLSELIAEKKAESLRSEMDDYFGLSFRTISGFGPNGAVIHYSSSEDTNLAITTESTFLFDSGSQYFDGTADITRTFHFGKPTEFMKEAYTRVLLGFIDLAKGSFRYGVYGRDIDAYAREPLWRGGLDYKHETGHGIGHFLNIHEGPIHIGDDQEPIELGVFNSDEPGYYEDDSFGIRIEDIMYTVEAKTNHKFSDYTYMTWRMSSLVPFEPVLIDFDMFSPKQIDWYNAYNMRIRDEVGPRLKKYDNGAVYDWMMSKTGEIKYTFTLSTASSSRNTSLMLLICSVLAYFQY